MIDIMIYFLCKQKQNKKKEKGSSWVLKQEKKGRVGNWEKGECGIHFKMDKEKSKRQMTKEVRRFCEKSLTFYIPFAWM